MNYSRMIVAIFAVWFALGIKPLFAAPDEYDDSQSHPLRVVAYLVHPAALLLEWAIFRPLHYLVSATETQEKIFGHRPHPPLLTDPHPARDYGAPGRAPAQAPAPGPAAALQEPVGERVRVVEVPRETVVYREIPKIVEVEKVLFPAVAFHFDSAELTDWGKGNVYLVAQKLKEKTDISVVIEGHTDEVGTPEYNEALGLRRAQRVMTELASQGIDPSRISTASHGKNKPLISQTATWARAVNRRVEFQINAQ